MIMAALRNAIETGDHGGLETLFESNERAQAYIKQGWIDINGPLESVNERSLLHLAAKSDNLELVVWALKYGADPDVSDKKGRKPSELSKNERIKEILKHTKTQAPIISTSLAQATSSLMSNPNASIGSSLTSKDLPALKGILAKVFIRFLLTLLVDELQGWLSTPIFCSGIWCSFLLSRYKRLSIYLSRIFINTFSKYIIS
jgi:hypothetical protein